MKIKEKLTISFWKKFLTIYRNLKRAYKVLRKGVYNDVSAPIQVYINVKKTNNLSWLVKGTEKEFDVPPYVVPTLRKAWDNIESGVIDTFGVSKEVEKLAKLQAEKGRMWCLAEIEKLKGNIAQSHLWVHRMEEIQHRIDDIKIVNEETNYTKLVAALDHNIDTWKMSIEMFFSALKLKQEQNKEHGRRNSKR